MVYCSPVSNTACRLQVVHGLGQAAKRHQQKFLYAYRAGVGQTGFVRYCAGITTIASLMQCLTGRLNKKRVLFEQALCKTDRVANETVVFRRWNSITVVVEEVGC